MKKIILYVIGVLLFILIILILINSNFINRLFQEQYNSKEISHFLVITIDYNQQKEYLGDLDNHKIYIENLNIEETNFRSVDAKNASIKKVINNKWTFIKEWKKYAWKVKEKNDIEIYKFENY